MRDDGSIQIGEVFDVRSRQFDLDSLVVHRGDRFDFRVGGKQRHTGFRTAAFVQRVDHIFHGI